MPNQMLYLRKHVHDKLTEENNMSELVNNLLEQYYLLNASPQEKLLTAAERKEALEQQIKEIEEKAKEINKELTKEEEEKRQRLIEEIKRDERETEEWEKEKAELTKRSRARKEFQGKGLIEFEEFLKTFKYE